MGYEPKLLWLVVGDVFLSSRKRSVRILVKNPDSNGANDFYITVKDVEALLTGEKRKVSLWKKRLV
jgi:hypothetical protein